MAAKIFIVALAVVCAFSACEAGIASNTADAILASVEKFVGQAKAGIEEAENTFTSNVAKSLDEIDALATSVLEGFTAQQDAILEAAANAGHDIAACAALKDDLAAIVTKVHTEDRTCLDDELLQGQADLQALQALTPKIDDLLAAARGKTASCEGDDGIVSTTLCLANIANSLRTEIGSVTKEVSKAAGAVVQDATQIARKASRCSSKNLNEGISSSLALLVTTKECVDNLVN